MAGNPMMHNKFFDKCTRTDIKNFIESYCNLEVEYHILIVGSPNAWEIQDVDINTKSKINLVCIDLSNVFENEFKNSTYGFKSAKFISANVFRFETDVKFDIILNRWFLHHLTTNNKKDFFTKCKNLTKDYGVIFSIDYFFKKFSNITERLICATEYNQYRSLYSPEPNLEKFLNVVKDVEVENYRGGKMDSIDNIQSMLESLGLKVEYEYTSDAYEVDNPELWGHYILKTTKHRLLTRQLKSQLKPGALRQIKKLKEMYGVNPSSPIIADIGANIGYFSESFLEVYPECELHAYEPQPDNLNELRKLEDSRFTIHEYGLFDSDGEFEIGMRSDGKSNNGTYSIFNKENLSSVPFKNANNETIRPHIVKMDVEGAEANILECKDFFSETQAILIELVYKDDFGMNEKTEDNLKKLGFKYKCHLGKNDQLWLK